MSLQSEPHCTYQGSIQVRRLRLEALGAHLGPVYDDAALDQELDEMLAADRPPVLYKPVLLPALPNGYRPPPLMVPDEQPEEVPAETPAGAADESSKEAAAL